ncbi:MAG TPA: cysteine desulfurase family protein [Sphingobacteriaceae bacterium]|nr:cysteine desulfurase family protein [Sphingobacteriaceae bacterium]
MGGKPQMIYMDHAATTPVLPEVGARAAEFWYQQFGNPSSVHRLGRRARSAVEGARRQTASLIGAEPEEIIFTSGGTEANNLAVLGAARAQAEQGRHIVTSAVEHPSVLEACAALEQEGFRVTYVPVDQWGMVDPAAVLAAMTDETILVSIMLANNEVGTVQPVAAIALALRAAGRPVVFHTDAVQAAGQVPLNVEDLGVDLLTLSGHKLYAPKGVGALYIRRGIRRKLQPLLYGGGQEGRMRPGSENVAGIVAMGEAAALAAAEGPALARRLAGLRDRLAAGLQAAVPGVTLNGHPTERLPNNVHISIDGVDSETLLIHLDMAGVAASSGSACTAGAVEPSHVLQAMGRSREQARQVLRLTLGRTNDENDVDEAVRRIAAAVEQIREGGRHRDG